MSFSRQDPAQPLEIAVIGSGISGMAAAWLLSARHRVTLYERDARPGGHSNTIDVPGAAGPAPVDTGFIVYNEAAYPNLTALFRLLDVPTAPSEMSFSASLDDGMLEYGGSGLAALFAQRRNLLRPRFWAMLRDIRRFYRCAPALLDEAAAPLLTLGRYLDREGYSRAFVEDHLLPMSAAIWSAPMRVMRDYPAASFIAFCRNHGLLQLRDRPVWRTVVGGSREYVRRLTARYADRIRLGQAVRAIARDAGGVSVEGQTGRVERFDRAVIATHADQALALLRDPSPAETALLGAFPYSGNLAILHRDIALMPQRQAVWSSWNYSGRRDGDGDMRLSVTYWLNRLQAIPTQTPLFLTLNPDRPPRPDMVLNTMWYDHPSYDLAAMRAQRELWRLQGQRNTWFCGAYFGAGFHEDGLQAGLAAAEALGGLRRPWQVADESGRIHLGDAASPAPLAAALA